MNTCTKLYNRGQRSLSLELYIITLEFLLIAVTYRLSSTSGDLCIYLVPQLPTLIRLNTKELLRSHPSFSKFCCSSCCSEYRVNNLLSNIRECRQRISQSLMKIRLTGSFSQYNSAITSSKHIISKVVKLRDATYDLVRDATRILQ